MSLLQRALNFVVPTRVDTCVGETDFRRELQGWLTSLPQANGPDARIQVGFIIGDFGQGKSHWLHHAYQAVVRDRSRKALLPILVQRASSLSRNAPPLYRSLFHPEYGIRREDLRLIQNSLRRNGSEGGPIGRALVSRLRNPQLFSYVAGFPGGSAQTERAREAGLDDELPMDGDHPIERAIEMLSLLGRVWKRGIVLLVDELDLVPPVQRDPLWSAVVRIASAAPVRLLFAVTSSAMHAFEERLGDRRIHVTRMQLDGCRDEEEAREFLRLVLLQETMAPDEAACAALAHQLLRTTDRTWARLGREARQLIRLARFQGKRGIDLQLVLSRERDRIDTGSIQPLGRFLDEDLRRGEILARRLAGFRFRSEGIVEMEIVRKRILRALRAGCPRAAIWIISDEIRQLASRIGPRSLEMALASARKTDGLRELAPWLRTFIELEPFAFDGAWFDELGVDTIVFGLSLLQGLHQATDRREPVQP